MDYARSFKSRSSEPPPASSYVQNRLTILATLRILRGALFAFDLVSQWSCGNKATREAETSPQCVTDIHAMRSSKDS